MRIILAVLLSVSAASAHDGPEDRVRQLTFEMARTGNSPALFFERATEYRAMGDLENAAVDLQNALHMDGRALDALKALAQTRLEQQQFAAALKAVNRGIELLPAEA